MVYVWFTAWIDIYWKAQAYFQYLPISRAIAITNVSPIILGTNLIPLKDICPGLKQQLRSGFALMS